MDRREVPRTPPIFRRAGGQPGPVPQGAPPDEGTPQGAPPSSGASPTGHPADGVDESSVSDPTPEVEGSAVADSVPEGASAPPGDEQAVAEDEVVAEAEKILLDDFAKLEAERNDYLDQLRRIKADFDNYRKRVLRQQSEQRERAAEGLVEQLLPVLDTFELAVSHGQGFEQVQASLISLLEKEGLERIDPQGKPFDPSEADAVAHEDGDGGPVVAEVLRPGYRWKGRVLRPAMVRVRG